MAGDRSCIVCDFSGPFPEVFRTARFRLVRCPECGLAFQEPQPSDDVLAGTYYQNPQYSRDLLGTLREITLQRAREKLPLLAELGALRSGARLLDVGCSSGAWLELAASEGMVATGVEIGESTAQSARRRGLDVRTGTLAQQLPGLSGERFDLITFWDVLEHVRDPRRELSLAARLLAPGGLVAATFPNFAGWYPRVTYRLFARRTGVWEYPELPVHLYDFSPVPARRLFERNGYTVVAIKTLPTPFEQYRGTSLSPERLGHGRRARALRLAFEGVRIAVYPLARVWNKGNSMFIAGSLSRRSS